MEVLQTSPDGSPRGITRRQFGAWLGLLIGGAGLLASGRIPALSSLSGSREGLAGLDMDAFASCVGNFFRLHGGVDGPVAMKLVEVADLSSGVPQGGPRVECFSIRFQGGAGQPLSQDTYGFEHRRLGSFPLFIVPSAPSAGGQQYVAIINRLVS